MKEDVQRLAKVTDDINSLMQLILQDAHMLHQYTTGSRCNATTGTLGRRRRLAPAIIRNDIDGLKDRVRELSVEYDDALRGVFERGTKVDRGTLNEVRKTRQLLTFLLMQ
jgi:hypothetical protein